MLRVLEAAGRQKAALVQALIKRPDLLILDGAVSALPGPEQEPVTAAVLEAHKGHGVIWSLARPERARRFDEVLVLRGGRVVEHGALATLNRPGTLFAGLAAP